MQGNEKTARDKGLSMACATGPLAMQILCGAGGQYGLKQ
jgi:hypothetical protein